jgi:hypothetical protein
MNLMHLMENEWQWINLIYYEWKIKIHESTLSMNHNLDDLDLNFI